MGKNDEMWVHIIGIIFSGDEKTDDIENEVS